MKFIIRDDDLSFYTDVEKLKRLYEPLFKLGFKVSFATIPYERETFNKDNREKYYQTSKRKWLGDNVALVKYIQEKINLGQVEIMLHGFDHTYKIKKNKFIGECIQKDRKILRRELEQGKQYLEKLFGIQIVSFVPPSNQIDAKTIQVLNAIGIKYLSGTILPVFNRKLEIDNIINWLKYIIHFIFYQQRYPYILKNKLIQELTYYTLTDNIQKLKKDFDFCQRRKAPFVLAVHHWELFENDLKGKFFRQFLKMIENSKLEHSFFKEAFN